MERRRPVGSHVFLLVVAVPALLVVVLGYVVGYGLWTWVAGTADAALATSLVSGAEAAGWITGLVALIGVVRCALRRRRARTRGTDALPGRGEPAGEG